MNSVVVKSVDAAAVRRAADEYAKRVLAARHGLDGLLGGLMTGGRRPFEVSVVLRVVRVAQIRLGLSEPVLRSLWHPLLVSGDHTVSRHEHTRRDLAWARVGR